MTETDLHADQKRVNARRSLLLAACFAIVFALFTQQRVQGFNDGSRLLAVHSLVQHGHLHLPESSWACELIDRDGHMQYRLIDMVSYNGKFYSCKPPVLTLALAGPAWVMKQVSGSFDIKQGRHVFLLTWLAIGCTSALCVWAFRRRVGRWLPPLEADAITVATLGGTLFLSYSGTINHHTIPAGAILGAFLALGMADPDDVVTPAKAALAGCLLALALTVDCGVGFCFTMGFGMYALLRLRPRRLLAWMALGALPLLLLHSIVQYDLFDTVLPVQMKWDKYFMYPNSYWLTPLGEDAYGVPRSYYWLLTLFGNRGLFLLSPILLVGAGALAHDIVRPGSAPETPWKRLRGAQAHRAHAALAVLLALTLLVFYWGFRAATNFGGGCFGLRYYLGCTPVLALYAARGWSLWKGSKRFRMAFAVLAVISLLYAVIGHQYPWESMEHQPHPFVRALTILGPF